MAYQIPKKPLGDGARFKHLTNALKAKGAKDPAALAAYIGKRKLGTARFQKLAQKGR